MSYTFEARNEGSYLHVTVTGKNSAANVAKYLAEVREKCVEHRCPYVLIEENLDGPSLGIVTIYNIVREASQRVGSEVQRIACVDVNPEHRAENMQFAETAAVNRGVNVRMFATVREAADWLNRSSKQGANG